MIDLTWKELRWSAFTDGELAVVDAALALGERSGILESDEVDSLLREVGLIRAVRTDQPIYEAA